MQELISPPAITVDPRLSALAAFGLTGCRRPLPSAPLEPAEWSQLLGDVVHERLVGMLSAAILAGSFPVTDAQFDAVAALHTETAVVNLLLERLLVHTVDHFTVEGVDARVLKGPALAHLDYDDPSQRGFADIDVLVRTADFDAAVSLLEQVGGRRRVPELRPGFDSRFGKGATMVMPDGLEVDLHRTFVAGPLGLTIDLDGLFEGSAPFMLANRKLEALPREERFLQACFGTGLGRPSPLHALRDVVQFALCEELDVERVSDLARHWQAQAVVARAVNLAWATFDLADAVPLSGWARLYRAERTELRVLDAYVGGDQSYTRQALAAIRVIPRRRDQLAYARALLFPEREHLAARRTSRLGHLRHGTRHLHG